jgi:hypothetical protein
VTKLNTDPTAPEVVSNERRRIARDAPPESEFVTRTQMKNYHFDNVRRIEALEEMVRLTHDSSQEILEYTKHAKLASQVILKGFHYFGIFVQWVIKIVGIAAVGWSIVSSLKTGKLPTFLP